MGHTTTFSHGVEMEEIILTKQEHVNFKHIMN